MKHEIPQDCPICLGVQTPGPRMCLPGIPNNQHCGELLVDASSTIAAVFVSYELFCRKRKNMCCRLISYSRLASQTKKNSSHAKLEAYRAILNNPIVYETNCNVLL